MPVRHVPIPIAEPESPHRDRASFESLADVGDRPLFITVFDHFSVTERKNPLGVIEAFRLAFAPRRRPCADHQDDERASTMGKPPACARRGGRT